MNQRTESAEAIWRFLSATDHAPDRWENQYEGTLDPALRPRSDKRYPTLTPLPLPTEFASSAPPALTAIASTGEGTRGADLDRDDIARIAFFTNGITRRLRIGDRMMPFRAAPTTGALYHIELYFVTGDLPGLPAGVYHYGAHDHALRQLRAGDFRQTVVAASGDDPALANAHAIMAVTSVFWRNAWKYAARAYRHAYWDAGTMLPNALAIAAANGIPAHLILGFADEEIERSHERG
jgi:SagB-type dehydrogenase family enzyme